MYSFRLLLCHIGQSVTSGLLSDLNCVTALRWDQPRCIRPDLVSSMLSTVKHTSYTSLLVVVKSDNVNVAPKAHAHMSHHLHCDCCRRGEAGGHAENVTCALLGLCYHFCQLSLRPRIKVCCTHLSRRSAPKVLPKVFKPIRNKRQFRLRNQNWLRPLIYALLPKPACELTEARRQLVHCLLVAKSIPALRVV